MRGFALVTACSKRYLDKLRLTLPTWQRKPRFKGAPLFVISDDATDSDIGFAKESFKHVTLLRAAVRDGETQKEAIFRSFFDCTFQIEMPHWVKLDADSYFLNDRDLFTDADFECDVFGHKWGYTKPGTWLKTLDSWAAQHKLPGEPFLGPNEEPSPRRHGHQRLASWICLHKTEFTRHVSTLLSPRMPVPSHDTLAWYLANRLPGRKWGRRRFKPLGAGTHTSIDRLRKILDGHV